MILKNIFITLNEWGENEGRYTGKAEFQGRGGKIEVNLNPETSGKVLGLLADQLVATAQESAKMMTAQVISTSVQQLENANV